MHGNCDDGVSGYLVERRNIKNLYKVLKKFCLLSEERKEMGLAGRKHMEENFDKRKVVEETILYFKSLVNLQFEEGLHSMILEPLISIIIPAYNVETYIDQCITLF